MIGRIRETGVFVVSAGVFALSVAFAGGSGSALAGTSSAPSKAEASGTSELIYLDQGEKWTAASRLAFYSQDQGSQLIPYAWIEALTTSDGDPFLGDQLARYGYLPNPDSPHGLPVGFTVSNWGDVPQAGMTCAACHTRQITVAGKDYRVDGGPAIVDFQLLLSDLIDAVDRVLEDDKQFLAFAKSVLGEDDPDQGALDNLKDAVALWYQRENALREGAYGEPDMWGLGRLDAVSMIFNRLVGLDIGEAPTYVIADNIAPADAPVRYPFLWNASIQDKTQWPGFADNGSDTLALARNAGEVIGVFGTFHPEKHSWRLSGMSFANNSVNYSGLRTLENFIKDIGPPKYPWPVDTALAARGSQLYERDCTGCHGIEKGKTRFPFVQTWRTPIMDVGTDRREYAVLDRTVADSGVLSGAHFPFETPIPATDAKAFDLLGFAVVGSLVQGGLFSFPKFETLAVSDPATSQEASDTAADELKGAFPKSSDKASSSGFCNPAPTDPKAVFCYESRVMEGIWAAGPYLHNGSVPTLEALLRPSSERPERFAMGSAYDIKALGIAAEQPGSSYFLQTTGCDDLESGNSRCGHEGPGYGTDLSEDDRMALLEYLKTL
ncbi:MAG: cytochrome c [Pseudomonadota bacterium]